MSADVYISYHAGSSGQIATTLCNALEAAGIKCFYAPRDVSINNITANIIIVIVTFFLFNVFSSSELLNCLYSNNFIHFPLLIYFSTFIYTSFLCFLQVFLMNFWVFLGTLTKNTKL